MALVGGDGRAAPAAEGRQEVALGLDGLTGRRVVDGRDEPLHTVVGSADLDAQRRLPGCGQHRVEIEDAGRVVHPLEPRQARHGQDRRVVVASRRLLDPREGQSRPRAERRGRADDRQELSEHEKTEEAAMAKYDKADIERRMNGAVDSLKSDLAGLRTGRANTSLLDPVMVEVYGSMMPLNQVATVSAPEPRMLSVQVWDKANVTAVEKGIAKANLGLNPMVDGQNVRLPMPDLTEERRKELAKLAGQYAEQAKIAIRNVRRDGMEALKEDEKKKEISEDERKRGEDEVQKLTDKYTAEADAAAEAKEKEIMTQ